LNQILNQNIKKGNKGERIVFPFVLRGEKLGEFRKAWDKKIKEYNKKTIPQPLGCAIFILPGLIVIFILVIILVFHL